MSRSILRFVAIGLFSQAVALAQPAAPPPGGGGRVGGFGGGGRMMVTAGGGAQYKKQTLDALKDQLAASDEEWEKLSPKVEKVMDAKQRTATGAGLSWSSQNGGAPVFKVSEGKFDTPAGKAMQEIRDAVADPTTSPEEMTKKLAALKEAVEKARADFKAAEKELRDALSPKQQAILVMTGHLEAE